MGTVISFQRRMDVLYASMRGPRVYHLKLYYKKKKGGSQPLLGTSDPEKMGLSSECRPPVTCSTVCIKDGADAAAFETIRIGYLDALFTMRLAR